MDYLCEFDQLEQVGLERSSMIKALGVKGHFLVVQFRKGEEIYRYPNSSDEFQNLLDAESMGKYFHKEVRWRTYEKLHGIWPEDTDIGEL